MWLNVLAPKRQSARWLPFNSKTWSWFTPELLSNSHPGLEIRSRLCNRGRSCQIEGATRWSNGKYIGIWINGFRKDITSPWCSSRSIWVSRWLAYRSGTTFLLKAKIGYRLGNCTSTCEYSTTCDVNLGYFGISPRPFESPRSTDTLIGFGRRTTTYTGTGSCQQTHCCRLRFMRQ
jgi:hypothetical protein